MEYIGATALSRTETKSQQHERTQSGIGQPSAMEWYEAFKTLIALLENIVLHPKNKKYRKVQSTNGSFHRKLGRLPGGLDLLIAVGFREDSVGALVLDEGGTNDVNELVTFLSARLIELKAGLPSVMETAAY